MNLRAGQREDIRWDPKDWLLLDIGFGGSKTRSSGLAIGDAVPECLTFTDASNTIISYIQDTDIETANLVIEAPLSVCFDATGNPKGRSIEKDNKKTRYWYIGPGATVMGAAMYLLKQIQDSTANKTVKLFEGFVTYKQRGVRSDHVCDVELLREVVKSPTEHEADIVSPRDLKQHPDDQLISAFAVMGVSPDCVPVVIRRSAGSQSSATCPVSGGLSTDCLPTETVSAGLALSVDYVQIGGV